MGKINKEWHVVHRIPVNPSDDLRLQWHIDHASNCSCRVMSPKLMEEVKKWKANKTT